MLSVRRPTQTTVLYTVSTRSQTKTIPARIRVYFGLVLRILAGILVARVLLHESGLLVREHVFSELENTLLNSPTGQLITLLFYSNITWPWRVFLCAATIGLILRKGFTEESLLVIRGLGIQTSTSSPTYFFWTSSTRFIPTSAIQDIFIFEAFKGFEVRFYLCVVVEGEEDVVVVFPVSFLFIYSPCLFYYDGWRYMMRCC